MDSGNGVFSQISEARAKEIQTAMDTKNALTSGLFRVGDTFKLKGSLFEIQSIGHTGMQIKLCKQIII